MRLALSLGALLATAWSGPAQALACSPPIPGIYGTRPYPGVALPSNGSLLVEHHPETLFASLASAVPEGTPLEVELLHSGVWSSLSWVRYPSSLPAGLAATTLSSSGPAGPTVSPTTVNVERLASAHLAEPPSPILVHRELSFHPLDSCGTEGWFLTVDFRPAPTRDMRYPVAFGLYEHHPNDAISLVTAVPVEHPFTGAQTLAVELADSEAEALGRCFSLAEISATEAVSSLVPSMFCLSNEMSDAGVGSDLGTVDGGAGTDAGSDAGVETDAGVAPDVGTSFDDLELARGGCSGTQMAAPGLSWMVWMVLIGGVGLFRRRR